MVPEQHERVVRISRAERGDRRAGRVELRTGMTDVAGERESRRGRGPVNNVGIPSLRARSPVHQMGDNLTRVPNAREHQSENDDRAGREEERGDRAVHPTHGTAARIGSLLPNDGVTCASW